ncbi:GNAT family N-acetyltransferase [Streptomyces sp. NPDC054865]
MHTRCSLRSRFNRYQASRRGLSSREWTRWIDGARGWTWVTRKADSPTVVAVTNLLCTSERSVLELSLLVEDEFQRQGIGRFLAAQARLTALSSGCRSIRAYAGRDNQGVLQLIHEVPSVGVSYSGTIAEARLEVAP